MLAYAANRPNAGKRQSNPNALLAIISIHVALIAIVMSAKMDLPSRIRDRPTTIDLISGPAAPRPLTPRLEPKIRHSQGRTPIAEIEPTVSIPAPAQDESETAQIDFGKLSGSGGRATGLAEPLRQPVVVRKEARLLTPASQLKPPYPASKLASEEEGVLTLRLSIDERGRVLAVDPVGTADRAFLDSARRYLIAHWRYQPATEGDRPVSSMVTITLHFRLDA